MATRNAKAAEPEVRCLGCGHLEQEHGTTGTRPCLTMVGDLLKREFCKCNRFRGQLGKVA